MKLKRIAMMVYVIICVFAASAQAAQISVESVKVFQGDNFTVNITVDPQGSEVYGAGYTLYFDNTLLKAISQTQGQFLSQDSQSSTVWGNVIDNPNGTIEYSESRMGIDFGVTDPGVLTTITFQAIGVKGVSPLNLSDLDGELLYATLGSIPTNINNGTCRIVEIDQTPIPTSTTATTPTTPTPKQTPTATSTTPTPTATAIQTPTIPSTPSSSPNIIKSPAVSMSPSEEKSNENNELSGFKATFAVTGLLIVLILKRKNVRK